MFSNARAFGTEPLWQQQGGEDGRLQEDLSLLGSAVPHCAEQWAGGLLLLISSRGVLQKKLGSCQLHTWVLWFKTVKDFPWQKGEPLL